MKINSINNQQNFKGSIFSKIGEKAVNAIAKHPVLVATTLAGSSVVAQKIVMSGAEATIGPVMDIGIGKTITKVTKEKDGRTNDSSKKQAIRTFSQSLGGTITGVIIRSACIGAATNLGMKTGGKLAEFISKGVDTTNTYLKKENASKWGKSIGGAAAILVMMFTNFLVDAPFINWINKKTTNLVYGKKEVKGGNN